MAASASFFQESMANWTMSRSEISVADSNFSEFVTNEIAEEWTCSCINLNP